MGRQPYDQYPTLQEVLALSDKERSVRAIIGEPACEAYLWLEAWAQTLGGTDYDDNDVTVDVMQLIDTGISHLDGGWGDYISEGPVFEGQETPPIFWTKLSALLGVDIPLNVRGGIFSCSC